MDGVKIRQMFVDCLGQRIFKSSFGKKTLKINDEVENAIELMCQYLNKEIDFEKKANYSLKKGIFIHGNCGSGKTELLKTYRELKMALFKETVGFKSCKDMNTAYRQINDTTNKAEKLKGIKTYASKLDMVERIFDEFGAEEPYINDFGNKIAIMPYIFEERYAGSFDGVVTHSTSNLPRELTKDGVPGIKEIYGNRIDSRLDAMFNIIVLGRKEDVFDFRK